MIDNKLFTGSFDPERNQINFSYLGSADLGNKVISIKDTESNTCIYSFNFDFSQNHGGWCIPTNKQAYDFDNSRNFSSFTLEIYDSVQEDLPDASIEIPLRRKINKKRIDHNRFLNFDPIFFNHDQFFVEGIYNGFFPGARINSAIDLGANIGLFTEWILDRFGLDTLVVSVEPNTRAVDAFKYIHQNKPNVNLFEGLVSDKSGTVELLINPGNSLVSSIEGTGTSYSEKQEANSITLPDLMEMYKLETVDLLKMDVEGAEYSIFDSIDSDFLKRFKYLLIEFHLNDGKRVLDIVNKIECAGFSLEIREDDTRYSTDTNSERGTIFAKRI